PDRLPYRLDPPFNQLPLASLAFFARANIERAVAANRLLLFFFDSCFSSEPGRHIGSGRLNFFPECAAIITCVNVLTASMFVAKRWSLLDQTFSRPPRFAATNAESAGRYSINCST